MEGVKLCKGGCKKQLCREEFGFNHKTKEEYKQCLRCREKKKKEKITYEENILINNNEEMEDKKGKRENRPSISLQKQQIVLKEQDYKCRGPGKYDNKEYECDMNVNGKLLSKKIL